MRNFQFSIFNQLSISKFSNRPLLKLVFIAVVCVILGVIVGLVLNYQTLKELRSEEIETALPVIAEEEEKIATYSGTIKPSVYSKGTHYLEATLHDETYGVPDKYQPGQRGGRTGSNSCTERRGNIRRWA